MHALVHVHTCTHARAHTHTHAHTHTRTRTLAHAHTHTHTLALQPFEASAEAVKTATQKTGPIMPITKTKPAVQMAKITKEMKVRLLSWFAVFLLLLRIICPLPITKIKPAMQMVKITKEMKVLLLCVRCCHFMLCVL